MFLTYGSPENSKYKHGIWVFSSEEILNHPSVKPLQETNRRRIIEVPRYFINMSASDGTSSSLKVTFPLHLIAGREGKIDPVGSDGSADDVLQIQERRRGDFGTRGVQRPRVQPHF
jgi:hypothetical protein